MNMEISQKSDPYFVRYQVLEKLMEISKLELLGFIEVSAYIEFNTTRNSEM